MARAIVIIKFEPHHKGINMIIQCCLFEWILFTAGSLLDLTNEAKAQFSIEILFDLEII